MSAEFDPYADWLGLPRRESGPGHEFRPDHYELLQLSESADQSEIEQAFQRACARLHIYTHGAKGDEANRVLAEVSLAYRTLSNPQTRSEYDSGRSVVTAELVEDEEEAAAGEQALSGGGGDEADSDGAPRRDDLLPAVPSGRVTCKQCDQTMDLPAAIRPAEVRVNDRGLRSDALTITVTGRLFRTAEITGGGIPWTGPQPETRLGRVGAALMAAAVAAIALLLAWCLVANPAELMLSMLLGSAGAIVLVAAVTYQLYGPFTLNAIDVAWTDVAPVILAAPANAAATAFLAGLARASVGTANPGRRRAVVARAIESHRELALRGVMNRAPLTSFYQLAWSDSRRRQFLARPSMNVLEELWMRCLAGEYPLAMCDQVTYAGRILHSVPVGEVAIARLRMLQQAHEQGLSVEDVLFARRHSGLLENLMEIGDELNGATLALLLAVAASPPRGKTTIQPETAFGLCTPRHQGLFEAWPSLILRGLNPEMIFCARGVFCRDMRFQEPPRIRRRVSGAESRIWIDHYEFTEAEFPMWAVKRLCEFCELCFGEFQESARRQQARPRTSNISELLLAEAVQCPHCQITTPMRADHSPFV